MPYVAVDVGVVTADVDDVRLGFVAGGDLVLELRDDAGAPPRTHTFAGVLALRWQEPDADAPPRDDGTYERVDSPWLAEQARLRAVDAAAYAHYVLGFNARGVLDVICRRAAPRSQIGALAASKQ